MRVKGSSSGPFYLAGDTPPISKEPEMKFGSEKDSSVKISSKPTASRNSSIPKTSKSTSKRGRPKGSKNKSKGRQK